MACADINDLLKRIEDNRFEDVDLQIEMCDRLYDIASECDDKRMMGTALFYKGETFVMTNPDETEKCVHACIPLLDGVDYELLARSYNLLGIVANNREDLTNSLDFYLRCHQICEEHDLKHVMGLCACNIGVIFQLLELYEKASEYFIEALASFEKADDSDEARMNIVTININLFIDYFNLHDLAKMKECYDYIVTNRKYLETQFSVELFEAEMMYISGDTEKLDETLKLAVEESMHQHSVIEFLDSYVMLCDFLHDLGKTDMLLQVLDLLEHEMLNFSFPRVRINFIKYRLECIRENRDFDEYEKWTREYIKTYEQITSNYHQSVVNSIELRMYVEELKDSEQAYERMAVTDGLTRMYNRYGLRKKSEVLLQNAAKEQQKVGVDIIDIDYFKQVNDHYGHSYGDDCLKKVAKILKQCAKEYSTASDIIVSRYGGDEFVVMIGGIDEEGMRNFASEVKQAMEKLHMLSEESKISDIVTLSQGLFCKEISDSDNLKSLIDMADGALYEVKENGRNGYKINE